MSGDEIIQRFCDEYHQLNNISVDRRRMQERVLLALQDFAEKSLDELEAGDLTGYLASRIAAGCKPTTVGKELKAVKPFVRWMWQQKFIDAERRMELEDVRAPRGASGNGRPRPYTRDDLRKFWGEFEVAYPTDERLDYWIARWTRGQSGWKRVQPYAKRLQMEAIVALALYGGLRREEVFRLRPVDMHPDNAYVVCHGAAKNEEGESVDRAVPWTCPEMRAAVKGWVDFLAILGVADDEAPWRSLHTIAHYQKPMRFRQFEMLLRNVGSGWEYHRLRHTAATELLRAGNPLETVQKIMGHRRIQQTLAYAELLPDDVVRTSARHSGEFAAAMDATRSAA